jgi:AbrB family looped-hinge helix DNA binding protein
MTLRIDRAGRIVLPKLVRDRLALRAGTELEIHESAEGILLKPLARQPSLVSEGRFLVHRGTLSTGSDAARTVKR